jgi:hypothetical protein
MELGEISIKRWRGYGVWCSWSESERGAMARETVLLFICWAHRLREAFGVSKEAVLSKPK